MKKTRKRRSVRERYSLRRYSSRDEAKLLKITPKREHRVGRRGRSGHILINEPRIDQIEERYLALLSYLELRQVDLGDIKQLYCPIADMPVIFVFIDNDDRFIHRIQDYCCNELGLHVYIEPVPELIEVAS